MKKFLILIFVLLTSCVCEVKHDNRLYNVEVHFMDGKVDTLLLTGRPIIGNNTRYLYQGVYANENRVTVKPIDYYKLLEIKNK